MDSQIQCPVCTLYLHVGMNLQDHLNTHPKEQVISALVNMTLLQQRANDDNANNFECSRYEPLADDLHMDNALPNPANNSFQSQQSITYFRPIPQHNSRQVMFLKGTQMFHERSAATTKNTSRHQLMGKSLPPLSIPTRTFRLIPTKGFDGKTSQQIPPPPPYHASIQDTMRGVMQRNENGQTTNSRQQSCLSNDNANQKLVANDETNDGKVTNVNAMGNGVYSSGETSISTKHHDSLTEISTSNLEQIHANADVSQENAGNKTDACIDHQINNSDVGLHLMSLPEQNQSQDMVIDESCSIAHSDDRSFKLEKNNDVEQTPEKRTPGLKVLSNVQVSPNTILNVSSLNSHLNKSESISLNDMIIIGSSPLLSSENSSQPALAIHSAKPKSLLRNDQCRGESVKKNTKATERRNDVSAMILKESSTEESEIQIEQKSEELTVEPLSLATNTLSEEMFVKPCSSKATSVIRLASQKPTKESTAIESTTRSIAKPPYSRQTKKLVVKLKKPFIPVIEEEANLHPPETAVHPISSVNNVVKQEKIKDDQTGDIINGNNLFEDLNQCETEMVLECYEDVPFSPLRQSYTPLPITQLHVEQTNDDRPLVPQSTSTMDCSSENDLQIVDVRSLNEKPEPNYSEVLEQPQNSKSHTNETDSEVLIFTITSVDLPLGSHHLQEEETVTETPIWNKPTESVSQAIDSTATIRNNLEKSTSTSTSECISSLSSSSSSSNNSSTTSSSSSSSANVEPNSSDNFQSTAGTSRMDYGLSTFLDYNEQQDNEYFNSGERVRLSPIAFVGENNTWNQRFSPPYTPFDETDKQSSYMDLDGCKITTGSGDRAPSADSLNIRTDEKMPAKGEISEQESNGDIEGSWSHQIYTAPENDNLPRYTSSYDTTVARESWSLSNEQNLSHEIENMSTILLKFTSLEQSDQNMDIKPPTDNILLSAKPPKQRTFVKARKYRCPACSQIFANLKEKRIHLIADHDYQQSVLSTKVVPKTPKFIKTKKPVETITSASCSTITSIETPLIECKKEQTETVKPFTSLNNYLLSYNWSTLKAKPTDGTKEEPSKLFAIIDSGNNYVCKTCEEQFNSIRAYDIHMATHPAECYTCGRSFKRWVNFSIHLKRHLNIREHRCSHCPKRFVLRQNMIEHMRIHSNEAPLKCSLCMKRFKRFSNLIQHRNRHHLKLRPQAKDFICSCGEVFHSQAKIAWHRETHDVKPKCCPYCRERFMHKNSLVRHIRLSHTERFHLFKRDSVECPYCKKKYIKSSLKMHMEQHKTSRATYECTICNKTLTTKWNLKQHKWIHASRSSKPFKCGMCTKAFIRETEYISHMNTHKAIKPYTCDHCGCQFARKYNWLRHTREHETQKKFRCDTCGKDFHRAYYLKEHKRTHTGERPFECVICGKTSTTKTNHNKHVKIHHARDPLTAEG